MVLLTPKKLILLFLVATVAHALNCLKAEETAPSSGYILDFSTLSLPVPLPSLPADLQLCIHFHMCMCGQ